MQLPHGVLWLLHCSTRDHWDWVSEELQHSGHGLCKYILAHTHTEVKCLDVNSLALFGSPSFFIWLDTDQYRMYIRLHVPWWPGVRWSRRLYQWNQLSMSTQWTSVPIWADTDCGLQHLVCTELYIHAILVCTCMEMHLINIPLRETVL